MPGLKIEDVLKQVRIGVAADSAKLGRKQTPWESSSLMGDFYFVGGRPGVGEQDSAKAPAASTPMPEVHLALQQPPPVPLDPDLELVKSLNGARYVKQINTSFTHNYKPEYFNLEDELTISGLEMIWRNRIISASPVVVRSIKDGTGGFRHKAIGEWAEVGRKPIIGREVMFRMVILTGDEIVNIYVISKDGNTITTTGKNGVETFTRQ